MPFNPGLVGKRLDPGHTVGVSPHRIVDAREIRGDLSTTFLQEMWHEEAHFEKGERKLTRPHKAVPNVRRRRHRRRGRNYFVEHCGSSATLGCHRADQNRKKLQCAGDLPSAQITSGGIPPYCRRESVTCSAN